MTIKLITRDTKTVTFSLLPETVADQHMAMSGENRQNNQRVRIPAPLWLPALRPPVEVSEIELRNYVIARLRYSASAVSRIA